jgi:non-heme chloroperoxidase
MPYVQSHDSLHVFYADAGTCQPIVFVASAWLDSRMWEFQIPCLVDHGFRCVAYDRRGPGRSDASWDGYTC